MSPFKSILIVRTDRIGDVVLSLPLAAIIKKHFPDCRVTFLLRGYTAPLALNNPNIDEVITLAESEGKIHFGKNIGMLMDKFDAVIAAYPTFRIALILFLAGIKIRVGSGYRWYSFLFSKKVYEHRKYGERHELEYNVRLLAKIGIIEEVNESNAVFGISPSDQERAKVSNDLSQLGIDFSKKIVIIHPGSGGSAVDLPIEAMQAVVQALSKEAIEILITGSDSESELCETLIVNERTKNLAGRYNLGELTALIEKCNLMIANSTGPIHIAAALGKDVIGFYPKFNAASPRRWGPYTIKKRIFLPEIECGDCSRRQCEKLKCMERINPDNIITAAKGIIGIPV